MANCQAGMFLAYVSPLGRALVDKRLYLPESWTSDPGRCAAAGVPKERGSYRSKTELALRCWSGQGTGSSQGQVGCRRRRLRDVAVLPGGTGGSGDVVRAGTFLARHRLAFGAFVDQSGISGVRAPPQTQAADRQRRTMEQRSDELPEEAWREINGGGGIPGAPHLPFQAPSGCG